VWTREDDTKSGYYRPMVYHKVRAGIDKDGNIVGWEHAVAGKSIMIGTPFEAAYVKDGVDRLSVEGVKA
jgi:isoquinoline 1-oxidoreductase subunit beta